MMTYVLIAAAGALVFLLTLAVGLNLTLLPRPKRFGFDVADASRQD